MSLPNAVGPYGPTEIVGTRMGLAGATRVVRQPAPTVRQRYPPWPNAAGAARPQPLQPRLLPIYVAAVSPEFSP
jgi:hypothetical protein